jgi:hypothetical protein
MPQYNSDQSFWDVEQYAKKKSSPGQTMLFDIGEEVKQKPSKPAPEEQKHATADVPQEQLGLPGVASKRLADEHARNVALANAPIVPRQSVVAASEESPIASEDTQPFRVKTGQPTTLPQKVAETYSGPQKSEGHLAFVGGKEYYRHADGSLHQAPISNPVMPDGRRSGRWEAHPDRAEQRVQMLLDEENKRKGLSAKPQLSYDELKKQAELEAEKDIASGNIPKDKMGCSEMPSNYSLSFDSDAEFWR